MGRLLHALKQAFRRQAAARPSHQERQERLRAADEKLHEADQRLDDQATRLHVLEWEVYGLRRRREPPP